jgi:citrate synthase
MSETAKITLDGKEFELPVFIGSEGEKAIDISKLRDESGYITLDIGYKNTGATTSGITLPKSRLFSSIKRYTFL